MIPKANHPASLGMTKGRGNAGLKALLHPRASAAKAVPFPCVLWRNPYNSKIAKSGAPDYEISN